MPIWLPRPRAQFALPNLDEERIAAAGIRKIEGQSIVIYTDLPAEEEVDELPQVFDAAVPLWCDYFDVEPMKTAGWKIVGSVMKDKERFVAAGLYSLRACPSFPMAIASARSSGSMTSRALITGGTCCSTKERTPSCFAGCGGAGPAVVHGRHGRAAGHASLAGWQTDARHHAGYPRKKCLTGGASRSSRDDGAEGGTLSLIDVMQYDAQAHLQIEAYGWCWAAAAFFDKHPLTQTAFRD